MFLAEPQPTLPADAAGLRPRRPGRARVAWFMALWTVLVGAALWWLLRTDPSQGGAWVLRQGDSLQQPFTERARDWFRLLHLNFQRIYPWILLGPYVAWLGSYCALERGRLWRSLPVHLLACAGFVFASHAINSQARMGGARVVIVTSWRHSEFGTGTNQVHVTASSSGDEAFDSQRRIRGFVTGKPGTNLGPDFLALTPQLALEPNLQAQLGQTPSSPQEERAGERNPFALFNFPEKFKPPVAPPELPSMRPLSILLDLFAYGAIAGMAHSVHFYRRYREREHRALALESNLAKARLSALQAQLQPHFLFNSLNAIATLLRRDPKLAEATLMSLSDLLRLTLSQSERQEVLLRDELEVVQRYLEIQQTRFGDRLHFEQEVEPETLECLVPTLLLQPIVENALRHGIEPAEHAGLVRLTARAQGECLAVTIEDDGVGLSSGELHAPAESDAPPLRPLRATRGNGIGLPNLRARLAALYGPDQKLELSPRQPTGLRVRIEIPWRRAPILPSALPAPA